MGHKETLEFAAVRVGHQHLVNAEAVGAELAAAHVGPALQEAFVVEPAPAGAGEGVWCVQGAATRAAAVGLRTGEQEDAPVEAAARASAAIASPGVAAPGKARALAAALPISIWRGVRPPMSSFMCGLLGGGVAEQLVAVAKEQGVSLCSFKAGLHAGESTES